MKLLQNTCSYDRVIISVNLYIHKCDSFKKATKTMGFTIASHLNTKIFKNHSTLHTYCIVYFDHCIHCTFTCKIQPQYVWLLGLYMFKIKQFHLRSICTW
jgi:hypothetical protein